MADSQKEHFLLNGLEAVGKQGLAAAVQRDNMDELTSFSELLNRICDRYSYQAQIPVLAGRLAQLIRKHGNQIKPGSW